MERYDCVIIGAGPAGLAAALYTSRERFNTVVLEKFYPGGQINNTGRIENYPGIEQIDGPGLIERIQKQATSFGAKIKPGTEVSRLEKQDDGDIAIICDTEKYIAKTVILAVGSHYRKLGVLGEKEFAGSGVSYCGTCDAPFFKGKHVVSVGGGNTAIEETLHLAKFAAKVTMIHRRQEFRATKVLHEELCAKVNEPDSNLISRCETVISEIKGDKKVNAVTLKNVVTGKEENFPCDGVFIFIGMVPNTGFLKGFVDLGSNGFIKCDTGYLRTKVPGVFAVGDCRVGAAMQLATSVGDGVLAAMMLKQYIRNPKWWNEPVSDSLQPGGW